MTKAQPVLTPLSRIVNLPGTKDYALTAKRPRKEKLSIYLVKENCGEIGDVLKIDNTKEPVQLRMSNGSATLYVKKEVPSTVPPWTQIFTSHQKLSDDLFGRSNTVGAVLAMAYHDRLFMLTFGSGFHLLKDDAIVRDFGLRVTLNSVDPDKLRSLDKASYDNNPLSSRTQSAREVDIFQLHIDSELDLLYAVTGASKVEVADLFGSHVTGRDALTLATSAKMDGIPAILLEALKRYEMKLPNQFDWVDNIHKVKDSEEIEILEMELDSALANPSEGQFILGEPEIIDWETQIGYSFDLRPSTPRHVILVLQDLVDFINEPDKPLTTEALKAHHIHVNNSEFKAIKTWSAYRCLYAELTVGKLQYILKNGTWYQITSEFVDMVDKYLAGLETYDQKLPVYNHEREDQYNHHATEFDPTFFLMDKNNVKIGGPYDKLEFCDLTKGATDFIHVKYYRASATLSHLFSQGYVAAYAFVTDPKFRDQLNPKLPARAQLANPGEQPDARKYRVVFAIATTKDIPLELPFFSKVTLKQSLKSLRALGYQVCLAKIEVDPVLFKLKKCKPKKAKVKGKTQS